LPDLSTTDWLLAALGAVGVGLAKGGIVAVSLVPVAIFALIFGARDSTGVLLPLLLVGDASAVIAFRQHARWPYIRRMLPPTIVGILFGVFFMARLDNLAFRPVIGWIILALVVLYAIRARWPDAFQHVPHARWFAWSAGLLAGVTTMLANSAGPVFTMYALAVGLPKFDFVGTAAWFFLIVNAFKVPFSAGLGLVHADTLLLNLALAPCAILGVAIGRWLTPRIPQRLFDALLLAFAGIAALRLIL